jgi:hypothetical protein
MQTAVFGILKAFKDAYKRFAKILPPPKNKHNTIDIVT